MKGWIGEKEREIGRGKERVGDRDRERDTLWV